MFISWHETGFAGTDIEFLGANLFIGVNSLSEEIMPSPGLSAPEILRNLPGSHD
jgi:hypothetical protein